MKAVLGALVAAALLVVPSVASADGQGGAQVVTKNDTGHLCGINFVAGGQLSQWIGDVHAVKPPNHPAIAICNAKLNLGPGVTHVTTIVDNERDGRIVAHPGGTATWQLPTSLAESLFGTG
jgi:hypothetical protein